MKKFWELTIPIILKRDIGQKDVNEEISKVINKVLLNDERLREYHELNTFKFYVYSGLYPVLKEFKAGSMYSFKFRCLDKNFALKFKSLIRITINDLFQVVTVSMDCKNINSINGLYTVTPAIAVFTDEGEKPKHWTKEDYSLEKLITRINMNAIKKYNLWYSDKLITDWNFIECIKQVNNNVIVLNYKNGKLLTNKFKIKVKKDEISQKLSFIVMAAGLLEKNSLGLGFCTFAR